jgi:hypothetical protein
MDGKPRRCARISIARWRLVARTLYTRGRRRISMQSLMTFLVNSFDCSVRLKDPAKVSTAPKDQPTYPGLDSAASLMDS